MDFIKIMLPFEENLYEVLSTSTHFETTGKGRLGNHLVKMEAQTIPIVRTTTQFAIPAQTFLPIHNTIIDKLNDEIQHYDQFEATQLCFNNALIEVYDKTYTKMNFHSDQALDLASDSYIALFSCYENPAELSDKTMRKLIIKEKETDIENEIQLTHNSVILFSVQSNARFVHKIIADANSANLKVANKWLGITFRKSKTHIHFKDNIPYFSSGAVLVLANDDQKKEFFTLRSQENKAIEFTYPNLNYSISMSDILMPLANNKTQSMDK
ncbi:MAG: hypothetical protein QM535_13905 [Limnohabitans sp.]|nr:hypothetical protein [Limnohabitans sp.]